VLSLIRGSSGHPSHPPLTDVAIGSYTFAIAALIANKFGFEEAITAGAGFYALLLGLAATAGAVITGFADYLQMSDGTPLKKTATYHWTVMACATVFFVATAWFLHGGYDHGDVSTTALVLGLVGYGLMSVGGWLGGAVVFKHGMRVVPESERRGN